jgi:hypothetical protein
MLNILKIHLYNFNIYNDIFHIYLQFDSKNTLLYKCILFNYHLIKINHSHITHIYLILGNLNNFSNNLFRKKKIVYIIKISFLKLNKIT